MKSNDERYFIGTCTLLKIKTLQNLFEKEMSKNFGTLLAIL